MNASAMKDKAHAFAMHCIIQEAKRDGIVIAINLPTEMEKEIGNGIYKYELEGSAYYFARQDNSGKAYVHTAEAMADWAIDRLIALHFPSSTKTTFGTDLEDEA